MEQILIIEKDKISKAKEVKSVRTAYERSDFVLIITTDFESLHAYVPLNVAGAFFF